MSTVYVAAPRRPLFALFLSWPRTVALLLVRSLSVLATRAAVGRRCATAGSLCCLAGERAIDPGVSLLLLLTVLSFPRYRCYCPCLCDSRPCRRNDR